MNDVDIVTDIHNAAHSVVTSVPVGTTVHDQATVTKKAGTPAATPAPTGTVTFRWFTNGTCSASPAATSTIALPGSGIADNTGFTQTPSSTGLFAFNATYNGDPNYPARTSACEPLEVVPPDEACTPGFWRGGFGNTLWNTVSDPDWTANGGDGNNPFIHTTLFNSFFAPHSSLAGLTMFDLVSTGGGPIIQRATARFLVAAYLNAAFGVNQGFTTAGLIAAWAAAVAMPNDPVVGFQALFNTLASSFDPDCPIVNPSS